MNLKSKLEELKLKLQREYKEYRSSINTSISLDPTNIKDIPDDVILNLYKIEDLIEIGFIRNKIEHLLGYGNYKEDVVTYFNEECVNMTSKDVDLNCVQCMYIGDYIFDIQLQCVKSKLNLELSNFLKKELKTNA